jgi:hypothetical protein
MSINVSCPAADAASGLLLRGHAGIRQVFAAVAPRGASAACRQLARCSRPVGCADAAAGPYPLPHCGVD